MIHSGKIKYSFTSIALLTIIFVLCSWVHAVPSTEGEALHSPVCP